MRTSSCNSEENWQKTGLLAYNCEGKKGKGEKGTRKMINKFRWQVQVWDRYDAIQLQIL
jgi:hypothetical protein